MSEFVVWYDSTETGAPTLNNANGSMISVLDACLVTGFNNKAITSLVVAGGVATATCAGHGYSIVYGKDVLIEGATPTALNGRKELTFVDANTFRFATSAASGTATGTITAKRAPLGWVKQFSGVNKAMYKRSDVTASGALLRIEDIGADGGVNAIAFSVEGATDVDTFDRRVPLATQLALGYRWSKGTANATAKQWTLIGDNKLLYLVTQSAAVTHPFSSLNDYTSGIYCFGDFESHKPGDAYNCFLSGETSNSGGGGTGFSAQQIGGGTSLSISNTFSITLQRGFSQLGDPVSTALFGLSRTPSGGTGQFVFPSPVNSGYLLNPKSLFLETVPGGIDARGYVPGYVEVLGQNCINHHEILPAVVDLPGRKVIGLRVYAQGPGRVAFDITGPWR